MTNARKEHSKSPINSRSRVGLLLVCDTTLLLVMIQAFVTILRALLLFEQSESLEGRDSKNRTKDTAYGTIQDTTVTR